MKGADLNRAHYIRTLYERCLDKQDPSLSEEQRKLGAELDMTLKLGPEWKNDVDPINDPIGSEDFYEEVAEMGFDEGKGEAPEAPEVKEDLLVKILDLLRRL